MSGPEPTPSRPTGAARALVGGMCFELVPTKSVEVAIGELAPGSTVTVTCSPAKGLGATQELVSRLIDLGHYAVPHLAARQVEDREHVARLAGWIRGCGLGEVFVIAGDAPKAAGPYGDSLSFLRDLLEHDTGLDRVGVAAYPDGHPFIDRAAFTMRSTPSRRCSPRPVYAARRRRRCASTPPASARGSPWNGARGSPCRLPSGSQASSSGAGC